MQDLTTQEQEYLQAPDDQNHGDYCSAWAEKHAAEQAAFKDRLIRNADVVYVSGNADSYTFSFTRIGNNLPELASRRIAFVGGKIVDVTDVAL